MKRGGSNRKAFGYFPNVLILVHIELYNSVILLRFKALNLVISLGICYRLLFLIIG